ncbi:unnamed protein product [Tenebrio molitor]|nr:unnamed protein product [Tenebrio molitor]
MRRENCLSKCRISLKSSFWLVATLDCDKFKCEEKNVCQNAVFHLNRAFNDSRSSALSLNKKAFILKFRFLIITNFRLHKKCCVHLGREIF